jgi:hypothetical protein
MPNDRFQTYTRGLTAPATGAFAIVPSDTLELAETARAIYVGGAGTMTLVTRDGGTAAFAGLAAGTVLPVSAVRVLATGTTATNLVGLV